MPSVEAGFPGVETQIVETQIAETQLAEMQCGEMQCGEGRLAAPPRVKDPLAKVLLVQVHPLWVRASVQYL